MIVDDVIVCCLIVVISQVLNRDHICGGRHLTVAPYYECLGVVAPGTGTEPCWTPPAVTVDFEPRIVQFVAQTDVIRSRFEASLHDLSPGCTITWPQSTTLDSGAVKISFTGANNGSSGITISKTCRDRLTELLAMMEVGSVDILQEIWPSFVEQWKQQFPEADESFHVQLDADKCCVYVVGEREKCRELMEKLRHLHSALVEELARSKTRISERIQHILPHQLSLLQTCGVFETESADDFAVNVIDNVIILEGQPDKIINWKVKMYQMLASAHSETVHVDEYVLSVLQQEPFSRYLDQLFKDITGVIWYAVGKDIQVYGENQDKVNHLIFVHLLWINLY